MSPEGDFNGIVHEPVRLRICGILRGVDEVDFAVVRDTLGVSDAALSKHLKVLATAGLLELTKVASSSRADARRLTWLRLTPEGRRVFDDHVRALQAIAAGAGTWPSSPAAGAARG